MIYAVVGVLFVLLGLSVMAALVVCGNLATRLRILTQDYNKFKHEAYTSYNTLHDVVGVLIERQQPQIPETDYPDYGLN